MLFAFMWDNIHGLQQDSINFIKRKSSSSLSVKELSPDHIGGIFRIPLERWTDSQKRRAALMFERYPAIQRAYNLSMKLTTIFNHCKFKEEAFKKLALWYNEIEEAGIESFRTVYRSIETHYGNILNYFNNRSTNASAEAFNAKIKSFRLLQGA